MTAATTASGAGLRRLADAIDAARPLTAAEERWIACAPWLAPSARRRERDRLIRGLADELGGASVNARAVAVAGELRHYVGAGWPLDRRRGAARPDTVRRRIMHAILSLDPDPPLSVRRLIDILGAPPAAPRPLRR